MNRPCYVRRRFEVIEFHVLGPLEAVRKGRALQIGAGKQRTLLAVLLLHANEVVSTDRLIDELWGERAPATASKILQGYVSQLRKAFATETDGDEEGEPSLLTRAPGYVLQLEPGQLDADRFETLSATGRAALSAGDAHHASTLLREALDLWRGPAFADFAFDAFAQEETGRLEELRLAALEERIDADLSLGHQANIVPELEALVSRHPLRERLRGQLMVALYRCGRQAEALQVYQDARRALVDELGLEPSRALQELEQAILRQDTALDQPAAQSRTEKAASERSASHRRAPGVFVGRELELAQLLSVLEAALSDRGRLVLIGGEPGIGKSRLAEELAARAADAGADVLWGRCWEAGGAPPYWPWVQALRSGVRNRTTEQLREELGSGAPEIADLLPDVRQRLPDIEEAPVSGDPQQARFRLFDSIADFLKRASRSRPLVLVLEDLNWADEDSLLLLEFVARELAGAQMLLMGTYRDIDLSRRHPLSRTLGELARDRMFERVVLRGLTPDDVARFIQATCSFAPDQTLVRAVHDHTEGNPFFVGEVVRLLTEEGALMPGAPGPTRRWNARIPEGVREAIGRRLDRLSESCNATLTVASAIGREFALDQLAVLVDLSEDRLLEVLEEALTAHLVEEIPGVAGRYQFTHTLIQATLADELSLTRKARLHARIAETLEVLYGAEVQSHAAELAHHYGEAETVLGPAKLVHYSALAGETALAEHALEQALAHFERALVAKGDQTVDDEMAAILLGLGRAQLPMLGPHELEPAVTSLRRAFDYYVDAGDIGRAVAAVAAYPLPLSLGMANTKMAELTARALDLVPRGSLEEGRLLIWYGWFLGFTDADYEAAQRAFHRVLSIAEREDDSGLERKMLANAAFVDAFHLNFQDCLTRGLRATELAQHAGDLHTEMAAHRAVAWGLAAAGDCKQARFHTAAALVHAEKLGERWWLTSTSFSDELLCLYEGDWQAAREMSELGLAVDPRDPRHLALRAVLECELGDHDAGVTYITQLQEVAEGMPSPGPIADDVFLAAIVPLARRISGDERLDVARAAAERVLSVPRLAPVLALNATCGLALVAVQRGDAAAAKSLYVDLASQAGTASFFIPLTIDRLLGLLAVASGRVEAAFGHFEDGLEFCKRAGYRPEYAWTASDYADALLERGASGDHAKALALQDEAIEMARELKMQALAERVRARSEADAYSKMSSGSSADTSG